MIRRRCIIATTTTMAGGTDQGAESRRSATDRLLRSCRQVGIGQRARDAVRTPGGRPPRLSIPCWESRSRLIVTPLVHHSAMNILRDGPPSGVTT